MINPPGSTETGGVHKLLQDLLFLQILLDPHRKGWEISASPHGADLKKGNADTDGGAETQLLPLFSIPFLGQKALSHGGKATNAVTLGTLKEKR